MFVRNSSVDTSNGPREDTLIVGCYIDDLYIAYNSGDAVFLYTKFVLDLQSRWSVEDEGEVSVLLNVEITRVDGGVELRQTNFYYINKLLATWLPEGVPPRIQPVACRLTSLRQRMYETRHHLSGRHLVSRNGLAHQPAFRCGTTGACLPWTPQGSWPALRTG